MLFVTLTTQYRRLPIFNTIHVPLSPNTGDISNFSMPFTCLPFAEQYSVIYLSGHQALPDQCMFHIFKKTKYFLDIRIKYILVKIAQQQRRAQQQQQQQQYQLLLLPHNLLLYPGLINFRWVVVVVVVSLLAHTPWAANSALNSVRLLGWLCLHRKGNFRINYRIVCIMPALYMIKQYYEVRSALLSCTFRFGSRCVSVGWICGAVYACLCCDYLCVDSILCI